MSDSVRPHRRQPTRLRRPWDSPGKNTGVGCHFLLQCMKVKSENEVTESCPTLSDPMDCSLPGSSVHGIFQARILEWGAIAWPCPTEQDPVSPTVSLSQQEAYISLLSFSIRGQKGWKHNHRKLTNLITWTTALSNSMKLWAMPCMVNKDRQAMVESSDKTWSTGERNGKPLQSSCLENPMNSTKM